MSVDTVNEALTKVRRSYLGREDLWGVDGVRKLTNLCDLMRDRLMADDEQGFIDLTQRLLGQHPDSMMEVLNSLFAELLGNEQAVWEEFEAELKRP